MSLKTNIQKIVFPLGKPQKILNGILKGKSIIISENTQWAPIFGRWEPAMQKIIFSALKNGDIYYDLGANFGLHGMLAAKKVSEIGHVYNFEPLKDNIEEIIKNYSLNNIKNYTNIQAAISNKNTILNFHLAKHNGQGSLNEIESGLNTIQVKAITLDNFINEGTPPPNFIKMDIEGAEGDALEGFSNNISKTFPIMIIELHSPEADLKVGKYLKEFNYSAYRFDTFHKLKFEKIKNLNEPWPNPDGIWGSVFCIPNKINIENFNF